MLIGQSNCTKHTPACIIEKNVAALFEKSQEEWVSPALGLGVHTESGCRLKDLAFTYLVTSRGSSAKGATGYSNGNQRASRWLKVE